MQVGVGLPLVGVEDHRRPPAAVVVQLVVVEGRQHLVVQLLQQVRREQPAGLPGVDETVELMDQHRPVLLELGHHILVQGVQLARIQHAPNLPATARRRLVHPAAPAPRSIAVQHPLLRHRHRRPQALGEQADPQLLEQPADRRRRSPAAGRAGRPHAARRTRPRSAGSMLSPARSRAGLVQQGRDPVLAPPAGSAAARPGARTPVAARKPGKTRLPSCSVRSAAAGSLDRCRAGQLGARPRRAVVRISAARRTTARISSGLSTRTASQRRRKAGSSRTSDTRPRRISSPTEASRASASRSGTEAYGLVPRASLSALAEVADHPLRRVGGVEQHQPAQPGACGWSLAGGRVQHGQADGGALVDQRRVADDRVPVARSAAPARRSCRTPSGSPRSGSARRRRRSARRLSRGASCCCSAARSLPVASGSAAGCVVRPDGEGRSADGPAPTARSQSAGSTSSPVRPRRARPRAAGSVSGRSDGCSASQSRARPANSGAGTKLPADRLGQRPDQLGGQLQPQARAPAS